MLLVASKNIHSSEAIDDSETVDIGHQHVGQITFS